jgi:hypothetical protein
LQTASRAAQLLSSGSRFHNASAVCDGQTMLEESRKHRLVAARAVRRAIDSRAPVDSLAPNVSFEGESTDCYPIGRAPVDSLAPNATQAEAFTPGRPLPLPASARVED